MGVLARVGGIVLCALCVGCLGGGDDGGTTGQPVTSCDWPTDSEWDHPIGYGMLRNSAHTTLPGQPLAIDPILVEDGCFPLESLELVEPPPGGTVEVQGSRLVYTPAADSAGFQPFVVRAVFRRDDSPACDGAEPDGLLEASDAGGGSDLARLAVHVVAPEVSFFPPCDGDDCVTVELFEIGAVRIPSFRMSLDAPWQSDVSGCSEDHWVPQPVFSPQADLDGSYAIFPFDTPGLYVTRPDEFDPWLGDCWLGAASEVRFRTVTVSRADFDSYCDAAWHNHNSYEPIQTLMPDHALFAQSSHAPGYQVDWPRFDPMTAGSRGYFEDLEMKLRSVSPATAIGYVKTLLGYSNPDEDKYVRAIRYGADWAAFEEKALAVYADVERGDWDGKSLEEKARAIDELLQALNTALGEQWAPLKSYVMIATNLIDKADRVQTGLTTIKAVYDIFAVDPNDPMQVAEALSRYLELLATITGKVLPPAAPYAHALAEGVKNMLPALRAMRDRARATNESIDLWLAETEEFIDDWEAFAGTRSGLDDPELDLSEVTVPDSDHYYDGWVDDYAEIVRITRRHLFWLIDAQNRMLWAQTRLQQGQWEQRKARLEAELAQAPSDTVLMEEYDRLMADYLDASVAFAVLFEYAGQMRVAFTAARSHALAALAARRAATPGFDAFLYAWTSTLLSQNGSHPYEVQRALRD